MATKESAPEDLQADERAEAAKAERARWMFAQAARFEQGAVAGSPMPTPNRPEVAFAGRSNVGKSTLLNALTNQKDLARTSNTPGRTREINFFALTEGLRLVDLPGYGYARASKSDVKLWTEAMFDYLRGRANLRRVFVLIDGRHGIKPPDEDAMKLLDEAAVSFQIVLTKGDKVKADEQKKLLDSVTAKAAKFICAHPDILLTSSLKLRGLDALRQAISDLADWDLIDYAGPHPAGATTES